MSLALENLKTQLRALGGFHEKEYLPGSGVSIPRGAITQILGHGKTEYLAEFLAQTPQLRVAWVEQELSIHPIGLLQRGLNLQHLLFIEAKQDYMWASLQTLSSSLFDVVVLSLPYSYNLSALADLRSLRRLQLASEKVKCSLVLLMDDALTAWPIALRLDAQNLRGPA